MRTFALSRTDGGVDVMRIYNDNNVEGEIQKLGVEVRERIASSLEIPEANVPADMEFRDAWKQNGSMIDHDLDKAKDIQLERIRLAREPKLAELDREYMIADEKSDAVEKAAVVLKKKALREITEPLKALKPTSIDDIKNAFPQLLKEK